MPRNLPRLLAILVLTWPAHANAAEDVQVLRDLEYIPGGHERQRLDLHLPPAADGPPLPVILYIHGGGWTRGDKAECPVAGLASHGFAVASTNYRFSQQAIFPAQIHDCKAAVRWLRANAAQYRLDPERIGVCGSSAGGHLVALLGTTAGVAEFEGPAGNLDQSSRVQAVVDFYGPTDFLTVGERDTRTQLLGASPLENREAAVKASPLHYVSPDAAPFLIIHGDKDPRVPLAQSQSMAEALQKAGVEATLVIVAGAGHGGRQFREPQVMRQVEEFFQRHLKEAAR